MIKCKHPKSHPDLDERLLISQSLRQNTPVFCFLWIGGQSGLFTSTIYDHSRLSPVILRTTDCDPTPTRNLCRSGRAVSFCINWHKNSLCWLNIALAASTTTTTMLMDPKAEHEEAVYGGSSPDRMDVILGRGRGNANHPGNKRFHAIVDAHREMYHTSLSRTEKTRIADEIVGLVKQESRFVKWSASQQTWVEVNTDLARAKVGQALRYRERRNHSIGSLSSHSSEGSSAESSYASTAGEANQDTCYQDGPVPASVVFDDFEPTPLPMPSSMGLDGSQHSQLTQGSFHRNQGFQAPRRNSQPRSDDLYAQLRELESGLVWPEHIDAAKALAGASRQDTVHTALSADLSSLHLPNMQRAWNTTDNFSTKPLNDTYEGFTPAPRHYQPSLHEAMNSTQFATSRIMGNNNDDPLPAFENTQGRFFELDDVFDWELDYHKPGPKP